MCISFLQLHEFYVQESRDSQARIRKQESIPLNMLILGHSKVLAIYIFYDQVVRTFSSHYTHTSHSITGLQVALPRVLYNLLFSLLYPQKALSLSKPPLLSCQSFRTFLPIYFLLDLIANRCAAK